MPKESQSTTTRRIFCGFVVCAASILAGCGRADRIDPPIIYHPTDKESQMAADAHLREIGGAVYIMANTGSMAPLISGGDLVVVDTRIPLGSTLGRPIAYWPQWKLIVDGEERSWPVVHRAVAQDSHGIIVEGDAVKHGVGVYGPKSSTSENRYRVTKANYIGTVAAIYRTRP